MTRTIDPRLLLAVTTSKVLTTGIRRLGRGGGTALPGLVAGYLDPRMLDKLAQRLPLGAVVVAGTNGKTTTSRMLAGMLAESGHRVAHNRSGSNLVRGISAALAEQMPTLGKSGPEIGVIESDENALPEILRRTSPRVVVLLNLFRDQLDRYGELETIASRWREALRTLDSSTTLVVNADDPTLAALAAESPATVVTFGLTEAPGTLSALPHASDAAACRNCESPLQYRALFLSHLGEWYCSVCGAARPELQIAAASIRLDGMRGLTMDIEDRRGAEPTTALDIDVALPGLYNAYNALAATAAARVLGLEIAPIRRALASFEAAFGRLERVTYRGRSLTLALSKNPVGFNEILRMITGEPLAMPLVIAINDLDADGRDVSWLWDVDFEVLAEPQHVAARFIAAGLRGHDLAVRLKYAGVAAERINDATCGRPLGEVLDEVIDSTPEGSDVFMLLTYTALLQLRQALADRGIVEEFWAQ